MLGQLPCVSAWPRGTGTDRHSRQATDDRTRRKKKKTKKVEATSEVPSLFEVMEAILGVDREVQNVLDKLERFSSREGQRVDEAIAELREATKEMEQGKNERRA